MDEYMCGLDPTLSELDRILDRLDIAILLEIGA